MSLRGCSLVFTSPLVGSGKSIRDFRVIEDLSCLVADQSHMHTMNNKITSTPPIAETATLALVSLKSFFPVIPSRDNQGFDCRNL